MRDPYSWRRLQGAPATEDRKRRGSIKSSERSSGSSPGLFGISLVCRPDNHAGMPAYGFGVGVERHSQDSLTRSRLRIYCLSGVGSVVGSEATALRTLAVNSELAGLGVPSGRAIRLFTTFRAASAR